MIRARVLQVKFRTTVLCSLVLLFSLSSPCDSKEVISLLTKGLPLPSSLLSSLVLAAESGDITGFVAQNSGWLASVSTISLPGLSGKSLMWEQKRALAFALVSIIRFRLGKGVSPHHVACPQAWADALQQTQEMVSISAHIGKGMWSASAYRDDRVVALVALPESILDVSHASFSRMQLEAQEFYASSCLRIARERVQSGLLKDAIIPFEEYLREVGAPVTNKRVLEYARILAGAGDGEKALKTINALIKNRGDKMESLQWEEAGDLYYALGEDLHAEKCYNIASGFKSSEKN